VTETPFISVHAAAASILVSPSWLLIRILCSLCKFLANCIHVDCSPDWACGLFSVVGEGIDFATNKLIAEMQISGVRNLEDLFKKALRELGIPVSGTLMRATLLDTVRCAYHKMSADCIRQLHRSLTHKRTINIQCINTLQRLIMFNKRLLPRLLWGAGHLQLVAAVCCSLCKHNLI
jgi:hypothetical protein